MGACTSIKLGFTKKDNGHVYDILKSLTWAFWFVEPAQTKKVRLCLTYFVAKPPPM